MEKLHSGGKDQGMIGETMCESPHNDVDKKLCELVSEQVSAYMDVGWKDRDLFERMLCSKMKDILTGREGLLEQYLHSQLDVIADTFNNSFDLKELTEEQKGKIPKDYQDIITDKGIGVNYSHATHAKLNGIIKAIKISQEKI